MPKNLARLKAKKILKEQKAKVSLLTAVELIKKADKLAYVKKRNSIKAKEILWHRRVQKAIKVYYKIMERRCFRILRDQKRKLLRHAIIDYKILLVTQVA